MKKTIKASLSLLLCILTLSGCGKGETTIPSSTPGSTNTATPTTPTDKDTTTSSTNAEHKYTDFSEEDKELQKNTIGTTIPFAPCYNYKIEEPKDDINQEWNVSTEESIKLTLGKYYSSDGKYSNPTIPVYTIQKTRSDNENMVIVICGEGYTKNQQNKFISDVKRIWSGTLQYEQYRSFADRFNVYALCTASESSFENEGSTFFDVIVGNDNSSKISTNMHSNYWKNHIFERCIGPEFIEKIHDAHVPNKTEPDIIHEDDYAPYRYVYNYINQFCLLVNTDRDFGDAYSNLDFGFKYFISPSDCYRATKTFVHELGHGLLGLGDEYMVGKGTEHTNLVSLNVAYTANPEKVKWKQMLGFRKTNLAHIKMDLSFIIPVMNV